MNKRAQIVSGSYNLATVKPSVYLSLYLPSMVPSVVVRQTSLRNMLVRFPWHVATTIPLSKGVLNQTLLEMILGWNKMHISVYHYGAPFVKILYLTDLAQKLLSLRIISYLCAHLVISAQR